MTKFEMFVFFNHLFFVIYKDKVFVSTFSISSKSQMKKKMIFCFCIKGRFEVNMGWWLYYNY